MMALYSQGNSRVKERKRRVSCLDKNEVLIWHLEQSQSTSMSTTSLSFQFDLEVSSICNREGNGTPLQYSWLENPMDRGGLQSMGSLRVRHDWATSLSLFTFIHWRRKWQPTPVFLPGESQGQGACWAAIYGDAQSWTRLKQLSSSSSSICKEPDIMWHLLKLWNMYPRFNTF